jgi:hypothetical protein
VQNKYPDNRPLADWIRHVRAVQLMKHRVYSSPFKYGCQICRSGRSRIPHSMMINCYH